jgi:LuxR family transcriptional regulator, maltose regulon positive regulatory protein
MARPIPTVQGETLRYEQDGQIRTLAVGSPGWVAWLAQASVFAVETQYGRYTARKERASSGRGGWYWRAYRKRGAAIRRAYLGKDDALTSDRLAEAAARLSGREAADGVTPPEAPSAASDDASWHPAQNNPRLDPLVATKLVVPPQVALVQRARLLERIIPANQASLTVVVAPAGFGKTTLLADRLQNVERRSQGVEQLDDTPALRSAWVSLDAADNSLAHFWSYLAAALEQARPGVGAGALDLLRRQPAPIEAVIGSLINALAAQPGGILLVLDDYHTIVAPAIHESLAALADRMPPHLHLVIASRVTPPLPLAKLRAHGRLAELSADDLRFSVDEAAELLNRVLGLGLAADDIAGLTDRTEGWVVGLRLAALALQRRSNRSDLMAGFGGTNRYVFDYLADEVLSRQPEHIQSFLLHTAVLDRMCGELCDALLGLEARDLRLGEGIYSSLKPQASSLILEEIERLNLFLTPLDQERRWYRYHALFADFLRERLRRLHPDRVPELHRRAAEWYESSGMAVPALDHARAAGDHERAARLVEGRAEQMLARRETATLLAWLRDLPESLVRARPRLCLAYAAALLIDGQPTAIEPFLMAAVRAQSADTRPGAVQNLLGEVAALRAAAAALQGHVARAIALSHQALEFLPADNALVRGFAAASLGFATLASGEVVRASQTLADAASLNQASGNAYLALVSLCSLAYLQVAQGQLRLAAETYRRALRQAEEWGGQLLPVAGWAAVGLAGLLYEWDDLEAAATMVADGIERCQQWGSLAPLLIGYAGLARIQQARGDNAAALETVAQARRLTQASHAVRLAGLLDALEATLRIAGNNGAAAASWAETCDLRGDWASFEHGSEHIALARVLISQGRERGDVANIYEAVWLLDRLHQAAEAASWAGRLIQIQALQALAQHALGHTDAALNTLDQALSRAAAEGYVRVFADEGPPMAALLAQYAKRQSRNNPLAGYIRRLRMTFIRIEGRGLRTQAPAYSALSPQSSVLAEQLTERELGILRRIGAGQSPDTIAREQFLAPSTVKWYLKTIYRKLDVHTRTAAVAAARALGLID